MNPNECKYCGCGDVLTSSEAFVHFGCGSGYWPGSDQWTYANKCVGKCAARVAELEGRIHRAVEVLDYITVEDWEERSRDAFEILRGNSPESPYSSPVIADQLAVADYYEAVRQRVPWMVSVEHIEDLVEGYRRCGVMAWRAAEQIKLIFWGKHEQTK